MELNKPASMSIKEWLIKTMSINTMTSERIIEAVVNHQFDSAQLAVKNCYSIEFSGFGKFYFNKKKAVYKMRKYRMFKNNFEKCLLDETITDQKRHSLELKLSDINKDIEILKQKMPDDEIQPN